MPAKDSSQTVWVLVIAIIAALLLYASFAGRTPRPQPEGGYPTEQLPPTT